MGDEGEEEVEIIVKTVGPARPFRLRLPSHILVCELRKRIAADRKLPVEQLKLVLKGEALQDIKNGDKVYLKLKNGESLMVAVTPRPPAKSVREGFDDDDYDDDLKFHIPPSTGRMKRIFFAFLREKMKFPDMLLMAIFSISLKAWAVIILWFALAPVFQKWDLGPIYVLGTGFILIFTNLGQRRQGDASAYSIFNDGFRELPGTLNGDRLDSGSVLAIQDFKSSLTAVLCIEQ